MISKQLQNLFTFALIDVARKKPLCELLLTVAFTRVQFPFLFSASVQAGAVNQDSRWGIAVRSESVGSGKTSVTFPHIILIFKYVL